jgi:hypothetical protein
MQSLFGMNVNLLKNNPDWRWYLVFGGTISIATLMGWLLFKYSPVGHTLQGKEPPVMSTDGKGRLKSGLRAKRMRSTEN